MDTIDKKVQEEDQKVSGGMPGAFESDQTAAEQAAEITYTKNPEMPEAPEGRESAAEPQTSGAKNRRSARIRRFLTDKAKKAPAWAKYLYTHKGQLFLTLLVALAVTAAFVCQKFLALQEKFGENFTSPFKLVKAAAWVKTDGETFAEALANYIWGSVYLSLAVYIFFYWVGCMGLFTRRKKNGRVAVSMPRRMIMIVLALVLWGWALQIHKGDLFNLPLDYLSRVEHAYPRWCLAWLLPALCLTDWKLVIRWGKKAGRIHGWFIKCLSVAVSAFACFCIVELSCESKLRVLLSMVVYSLVYWVIVICFFYILFRRMRTAATIALALAEFIGLGNYCVMQFRGTYVMSGDLTVIGTALEVAGNYKLVFDKYFFIPIGVLLAALVAVRLLNPGEKLTRADRRKLREMKKIVKELPKTAAMRRARRVRLGSTVVGEICLIALTVWGLENGFLFGYIKGNTWNYTNEVEDNGYLPFFLSNMMATGNVKLEGYDVESAREALVARAREYEEKHGETKEVQTPNIIVIQNEAFADMSVLYDYELSEDCMPFIHSLKENTQKGYVNASVTGGPTANTEFEFLSRYSLAYLPTGTIPYAQYVKSQMPSILTVLKNQSTPYYAIGYHPYHASGYNRESVYQVLGFDEAVFYEDTTGMKRFRKLLSDRGDYEDVIKMYEENERLRDQPFFMFNVTIQNHSPFTYLNDKMDRKVEVSSFKGSVGMNNYFTLLRESDEAFKELIQYFSNIDDPTIILMYGDHQPSWDDDSQKVWADHLIPDDTNQQTLNKYYIPYVMWANFDIDEYDGLKYGDNEGELNQISMNYLSAKLLEAAGVELSDYDKYLLNLHETIPAVNSKGYWEQDGTWHTNTDTGDYAEILFDYNQICYNLLFDRNNHLWDECGGRAQIE